MTLVAILVGTLLAGIGSVWLAAALSFGALARDTQHIGLVFFFLLDKAELWHHGHEHHHDAAHGHDHAHDHPHAHAHPAPLGSWSIVTGDSVHCFGDGILIASAFMADMRLGFIAAVAVLAHEVPHHMGDLMVLRAGADNRRMALINWLAP